MRINLGKEGDQPFDITQSCVSREHAVIDISEDGKVWTLTDTDSTNGTFVREENGKFRRVVSIQITPMTFIRLGPETVHGCSFYAKRVLGDKDNYEYFEEFEEIQNINKKYAESIAAMEAKTSKAKLYQRLISMGIVFALLCLIPFDSFFGMPPFMLRMVLTPVISEMITFFFDPKKKVKQLKDERDRFYDCPNPECSHKLKESEIEAMSCSKCKAR